MNKQISIANYMHILMVAEASKIIHICFVLTHPFFLWYDVDFVE